MAKREHIPARLRHEVFKRDNYRCRECGATNKETTLEIDHIVPVSKGGTNNINNLQTLCKACNRAKHTRTWVGGEVKQNPIVLDTYEEDKTKIIHDLRKKNGTTEYLKYKEKIDKEKHEHFMVKKYGTKTCPHCGKKILKNAIRCKYCKNFVSYNPPEIKRRRTKKENKMKRIEYEQKKSYENLNSYREQKLKETHGTKICPHCGKEILKNAIRCKYCKCTFKECYMCGKLILGNPSRCNYCNSIFIKCPVCGEEISDNASICKSCKSTLKKCPKCNKVILGDATKCKYCNSTFKKCPKCGKEISDGSLRCKYCHSFLIIRKIFKL